MEKTSKIHVAGHRGLVGSAIVRRLKVLGYENIITRTHSQLDLTDQKAVADFFLKEKPEYVFMAAAKVGGIYANNTYPAEFIYKNLAMQTNVIYLSYLYNVKRLLFLGSSCIYPKMAPQPLKEEYLMIGPLEPTNSAYAVAKIAGIEMCNAYNRQYGTRFIPVMPTNLYGPGDNFDLETSHVLPALIRKFHLAKLASKDDWEGITRDIQVFGPVPSLISGIRPIHQFPKNVTLWGTGSPRREFLHVDDLADACCYLMNHYEGTDLINIGTGIDMTIRDLAMTVQQIVGFDGKMIFDQDKPDGTPRKLLDVTKINNLGWRASIDLKKGIRQVYDWYCGKGASKN